MFNQGHFMKLSVYVVFLLFALLGIQIGEAQMKAKTLIDLLNYSKTLIQNGEVKFIYYRQKFLRPDEVGEGHRKVVADLKRQLREEPAKSDDPKALRREIIRHIEDEKKYGAFEYSNGFFDFVEGNLVFQDKYMYRLEIISRFEKYPSLASIRHYGGGGQYYYFSNSIKSFKGLFPTPSQNEERVAALLEFELEVPSDAFMNVVELASNSPPPSEIIDETSVKVHFTKDSSDMPIYVITEYYNEKDNKEKVKWKRYVRLKDGLPEVFRTEYYYIDDESNPEEKRHFLGVIVLYSDFRRVEALNITIPYKREEQQLHHNDGFIHQRSVMMIKEIDFNLELPSNFFHWNESELDYDDGQRKRIH